MAAILGMTRVLSLLVLFLASTVHALTPSTTSVLEVLYCPSLPPSSHRHVLATFSSMESLSPNDTLSMAVQWSTPRPLAVHSFKRSSWELSTNQRPFVPFTMPCEQPGGLHENTALTFAQPPRFVAGSECVAGGLDQWLQMFRRCDVQLAPV
ncbi:hypothetical protein ANO11243_092390 [Dothideomycetidae sp. 11243]|nr:hypothetical protein ANO11243_092390 [fungal sp. No.11243]